MILFGVGLFFIVYFGVRLVRDLKQVREKLQ